MVYMNLIQSFSSIKMIRHLPKTCLLAFSGLLLFACSTNSDPSTEEKDQPPPKKEYPVWENVTVEVLDPTLEEIVSTNPMVQKLGEGYTWSEGPVWVEEHQMLLFSDVPQNVVHRWDEAGGVRPYLKPSGYTGEGDYSEEPGSNGITVDDEGNLLLCQHGNRVVAKMDAPLTDPEPKYISLVDNYQGKRFNSPNDLCLSSSGYLYFTDPPYGLPNKEKSESKELDFQGVYRWHPEHGVELVYDGLSRPNGIALSEDERHLYVANSDGGKAVWMVFDIDESDVVSNGRIFYDATANLETERGLPDGLKVDSKGNIFATGPGGIWVFNKELKPIGRIKLGTAMANCEVDEKGKWLYITADDYLLRVKML